MNLPTGIQGVQRGLPKAVALALLVGGTGGFVVQHHQSQHIRLDADPLSAVVPDADQPDAGQPDPPVLVDVMPQVAPGPSLVRVAEEPSRSVGVARHALPRTVEHHRDRAMMWPGRHRRDASAERADAASTRHTTGELDWTALARCEAGGNPHAVDPSGTYGGLYQFDTGTWHHLGGHGRPQDASASEQTTRARRLYHQRGSSPWPTCGRRAAG